MGTDLSVYWFSYKDWRLMTRSSMLGGISVPQVAGDKTRLAPEHRLRKVTTSKGSPAEGGIGEASL